MGAQNNETASRAPPGNSNRLVRSGMDAREEWRQIANFPRYRVSNLGGAQRLNAKGEWVSCAQNLNTSGYPRVVAVGDGGTKRAAATHIFVAEAFIGPRPSPLHEVMHIDGTRTNNHVANLRYGTRAENSQDAVKHGTHQKFHILGEQNGLAKLSTEKVLKIVERARSGAANTVLAAEFKVTAPCIRSILIGKTWGHVTGIGIKDARAETPANSDARV